MEQKIDAKKSVFNKDQYSKTIDTSFREFGVTTVSDDIQSQPNITNCFMIYHLQEKLIHMNFWFNKVVNI